MEVNVTPRLDPEPLPRGLPVPAPAPLSAPTPPPSLARPQPERSSPRTRLFAFLTLTALVLLFGFGAHTVWRALSDSFVVPAILSPDSDVVLGNKLKLGEIEVERGRAAAELEGLDADIAAAEKATARLQQLHQSVASAARWTTAVTTQKAATATADRTALEQQRRLLAGMLQKQRAVTGKAESDLEARLISSAEYVRELQTQNQLELAVLDNARASLQTEAALREAELGARAVARRSGAPVSPEVLVREEQAIRIELELNRLASEVRAKLAQKRSLLQRLGKIDELSAQMRQRPIYRAVERSLEVAFVPYTQLDGVQPGAEVLSCRWGLFFCHRVGSITEVVPGEVVLPDPWGNQARGQYAVLTLADHACARAKTLRVRPSWGAPALAALAPSPSPLTPAPPRPSR